MLKRIQWFYVALMVAVLVGCGSTGDVDSVPIQTLKDTYQENETVSVKVDMALSGDEDWIGVFHKNDDNSWGNVVKWNWVTENGTLALTSGEGLMPEGEYEVRLFFHNANGADVTAEATYGFGVTKSDGREFGTEGPYLSKVKSIKTTIDGEVRHAIYYVEGEQDLPVIIYMSGWKSNLAKYDGFLKFVSSLGYYVIAESERGKCFHPDVYEQNLTIQLEKAHDTYGADITKMGIIGHSSGGGTVHYLMNYFKSNNIAGTTKSFAMSLDGWFPFGTDREMLNNFDSPTLLIQFGGLDGINQNGTHPDWDDYAGDPYHHYQDPKINLAIFKLLTNPDTEKEYVVLEADNNHSYFSGVYDTLIQYKDFLAPVDEFINHTLGRGEAMELTNQSNDVITNDVISEYRYYCHIGGYNFCDLNDLKFE